MPQSKNNTVIDFNPKIVQVLLKLIQYFVQISNHQVTEKKKKTLNLTFQLIIFSKVQNNNNCNNNNNKQIRMRA